MLTKQDVLAVGYTPAEYETATRYIRRKNGHERPAGTFDRARRFWLDEDLPCCRVRTPSRAHPFSQLKHGCSMIHVANLEGADLVAVRRLVSLLEKSANVDCPDQQQALLAKYKPPRKPVGVAATPNANIVPLFLSNNDAPHQGSSAPAEKQRAEAKTSG